MTDNKDMVVNCPACGTPMVKVHMPERDFFLDVCVDGCGGIYFDNRELKYVDEKSEDITPLVDLLVGKKFKTVDTSQNRICAVCGNTMVKNFSSSNHSIEIDECYTCGGKFLDYSELEKIREEYETEEERAQAAVNEMNDKFGAEIASMDLKHSQTMKNPNKNSKIMFWFSDFIEKNL